LERGYVILPADWTCRGISRQVRKFENSKTGKYFYIPLPYGEQDVYWWRDRIARYIPKETLEVRLEEPEPEADETAIARSDLAIPKPGTLRNARRAAGLLPQTGAVQHDQAPRGQGDDREPTEGAG